MEDNFLFDEQKAIDFIRKELPKAVNEKFEDDDILYIIDIIWDFYEKNGMLTINSEIVEEEELDPDKLIAYVKKEIQKDREIMIDPDDVGLIVKAELDYEESLEDFI
ncbi:MAG: hypothetical protein K2J82_09315 [Muribaculaceae bacterium]|nr:hypothetical protein [Muribaculaceae bacterium]